MLDERKQVLVEEVSAAVTKYIIAEKEVGTKTDIITSTVAGAMIGIAFDMLEASKIAATELRKLVDGALERRIADKSAKKTVNASIKKLLS